MKIKFNAMFRWLFLLILTTQLAGCFYWIRAYQTYLQMDEFDQHFAISSDEEFSVHFKAPKLYSEDFVSLSKLQPSQIQPSPPGERWRYWFRKIDQQNQIIKPEVTFYFDLSFNQEQKLTIWSFSSLFLQIAPAEFLEASFRSLGSAKINKEKRQLRANTDLLEKISAQLPQKQHVLNQLGEPISISHQKVTDEYLYQFLLETSEIEEGYEERALSTVKLTFDNTTNELVKMSGRFAGLKISIDYRKYLDDSSPHVVDNLRTCSRLSRVAASCVRKERRNRSLSVVNEGFEHRLSAISRDAVDLEQVLRQADEGGNLVNG